MSLPEHLYECYGFGRGVRMFPEASDLSDQTSCDKNGAFK